MTEARKELREEVARTLYESCQDDVPGLRGPPWDELADSMKQNFLRDADAAIAVALEKAAKVADAAEKQANEDARYWDVDAGLRCQDIAAAIRALIKDHPGADKGEVR